MQISERVRTMKPSLTLSVNTRAMESVSYTHLTLPTNSLV